jgi:hypothetical protein
MQIAEGLSGMVVLYSQAYAAARGVEISVYIDIEERCCMLDRGVDIV